MMRAQLTTLGIALAVLACVSGCSDRSSGGEPKADRTAADPVEIRPDAPSCADVGARVAELAGQRFGAVPAPKRASADQSVQALRDEVVATCKAQLWTADVRTCMVEANSRDGLASCEPQRAP